MNAIDLTTLAAVRQWLGIAATSAIEDQIIADAITAFSASVLRMTGRGPIDGTIPTTSPFVTPVSYDEVYDGTGTLRLPIRNWPIVTVTSITIDGNAIPQSTSIQRWGWVIDGDRKFLSLRGGYSPAVATFQNYRLQASRGSGYPGAGFNDGIQNVEVIYQAGFSGVPADLEMRARRIVGRQYKMKGWIGQRSQMMANGAGSIIYEGFEMSRDDYDGIMYYKRMVA